MKIIVSFSGGRTSAYMGWWLKHHTDHELKFVFMNTGCEHEKTLEFLNECDQRWGLNLTWIEAVVNHAGRGHGFGTRHKVVDFKSAARNGEPFEEVVKKYGISNPTWKPCSRECKEQPHDDYVRDSAPDFYTAIGIRADEFDRVSAKRKEKRLIYPLIDMNPTTENDIMWWWQQQDFNLRINQYEGNCRFCWQKSFRKLATIAKHDPSVFDFPDRMEKTYPNAGMGDGPRTFYRGHRTAQDVLAMAKDVIPFNPSPVTQPDMFWDETGGCSESCEVFS